MARRQPALDAGGHHAEMVTGVSGARGAGERAAKTARLCGRARDLGRGMMETKIYLPPEPEFEEAVQTVIPHNREAEAAVIGSIFINPDVLPELALFLEPRHFYIHKLRWIYEACLGVTDIDLITIGEALERRGMLAEAGGPAYLTPPFNALPSR